MKFTSLAVIYLHPVTKQWVAIAHFSDTSSGLKRAKMTASYHWKEQAKVVRLRAEDL